jgi:cytochrome b561
MNDTIAWHPGASAEARRYNGLAQALHWLTAALMLAVLPLGWIGVSLTKEAPTKGTYFVLHRSVGLTILALAVARVVWRLLRPAPPEGDLPRGLALVGRVNQWLLYAVLLIMPTSGYLVSAYGGRPTPYFWLVSLPGFEKSSELHELFERVHLFGQWALYASVVLHIAGVLWRLVICRDGVFDRMLPEQRLDASAIRGHAGLERRTPRPLGDSGAQGPSPVWGPFQPDYTRAHHRREASGRGDRDSFLHTASAVPPHSGTEKSGDQIGQVIR